jgi:hypothetical protein
LPAKPTGVTTLKNVLGVLLALLAFGFFISLTTAQATWGTGAWTPRGREHAATMVAVMLLSTIPFALLLAGSLWGSLVLFRRADAHQAVTILELVFGVLILLTGFIIGIVSMANARSVEPLFEGAFFVLLETASGMLLLYLAFRNKLLQGLAGKVTKIILAIVLLLLSLLPLLAMLDVINMPRFEGMRGEFLTVALGYALIPFGAAVVLLITAFKKRLKEASLSIV